LGGHVAETTAVDRPICGAKTRAGGRCKFPAGMRTTHPGQGKCYRHGGTKPGDPRLKSGRYSSIERPRIRDLIAAHEADPDPLNLLPEIAALRALFQDFIERYETMTEALLAWHASWQITRRPLPEEQLLGFEAVIAEWENALGELGENATDKQRLDLEAARKFVSILRGADAEQRPRQIMDLSSAAGILGEIGKMVERVEKARAANAISRPELYRVTGQMGRDVRDVLEACVPDPAVADKIAS
jgi:hypothetical protein